MRTAILQSAAIVILTLLAAPGLLAAKHTALRVEIKKLAEDLASVMKKNGGERVAIGKFIAAPEIEGSTAPAMQLMFTEEFKSVGIAVDPDDFQFKVTGEYKIQKVKIKNGSDGQEINVVKLEVKLHNKAGRSLLKTPTGSLIFGPETVAVAAGATVSGPPTNDPLEISDRIGAALKKPLAEIREKRIVLFTGQFGIDILERRSGDYLPTTVELDRAKQKHYATFKEGDVYGVRIHNFTNLEAAVDLRIDGVSFLRFAATRSEVRIVPPNSYVDILGWQKSRAAHAEFKVASGFANTVAAKRNLTQSATGLISVTFAAAWKQSDPVPNSQRTVRRGARLTLADTGARNKVANNAKQERRVVGVNLATISVRYKR